MDTHAVIVYGWSQPDKDATDKSRHAGLSPGRGVSPVCRRRLDGTRPPAPRSGTTPGHGDAHARGAIATVCVCGSSGETIGAVSESRPRPAGQPRGPWRI